MLKELLQDYKKFLLPIAAASMLGFIFGIYAKPSQEDVYIDAFGFKVGREITPIREITLADLANDDVSILADKVRELTPRTPIGERLRELVLEASGPFEGVKMEKALRIRLNTDGAIIGYRQARVCKGSPLLNKILLANKVIDPEGIQPDGMISIHVRATDVLCTDQDELESHELWLDKDTLAEWVPNLKTLPDFGTPDTTVSANAVSVVSIVSSY